MLKLSAQGAMTMSDVTIYVKKGCPYCAAAMEHYKSTGTNFRKIDVHEVDGAKEELLKLSNGQRIVPVILENGKVKLGFNGG